MADQSGDVGKRGLSARGASPAAPGCGAAVLPPSWSNAPPIAVSSSFSALSLRLAWVRDS